LPYNHPQFALVGGLPTNFTVSTSIIQLLVDCPLISQSLPV